MIGSGVISVHLFALCIMKTDDPFQLASQFSVVSFLVRYNPDIFLLACCWYLLPACHMSFLMVSFMFGRQELSELRCSPRVDLCKL